WEAPHYPAGHAGSAEDLLVVDGLVWCGRIAGGGHDGVFTGRDPRTGDVKREFTPDVETYWFHHRCYRAKATDEYILPSRTGIEFVDIRDETWETHHWVRGACTYGIVPCNGLIYAPPHPCACYLESKLSGFCALAPVSQRTGNMTSSAQRLVRGPAYGTKFDPITEPPDQWPTYRHDPARSGATAAAVKLPLSQKWQTDLGEGLTSPVVARGRVFVASRDNHALHALNAKTGDKLWSFTAGAGVDSPPTFYQGWRRSGLTPDLLPRLRDIRLRRWQGLLSQGFRRGSGLEIPGRTERHAARILRQTRVGLARARKRPHRQGNSLLCGRAVNVP
ncbi:MAG: outer membrane protein assembly factor BamB family protein, partial [Planctomycetota bacterium]